MLLSSLWRDLKNAASSVELWKGEDEGGLVLYLELAGVGDDDVLLGAVGGTLGDVLCERSTSVEVGQGRRENEPMALTMSMPSRTFPKTT